jgi:hypothetical protein
LQLVDIICATINYHSTAGTATMGTAYILATDPRGLPIEFWDARWEWITLKHPDLPRYNVTEHHLQAALENPEGDCIYASKKYPDCELYYTRFSDTLQIRVVVKFILGVGEILTAHFVREHAGETPVWVKGS